jgi:hypothetical protein
MAEVEVVAPIIINLESNCSPAILAGILGVNVAYLYQNAQAGIIPSDFINYSYRTIIRTYYNYYKKNMELKVVKENNEHELRIVKEKEASRLREEKFKHKEAQKKSFSDGDSEDGGLHPLVAAKMKQEIRLNVAKEAQLWLKIAIERQEYIAVKELFGLVEPFMQAIKNLLVSLANDVPEVTGQIDQGMEHLYNLGTKIMEHADIDSQKFVERMLDKDIDITDIELGFIKGSNDEF